MQLHIAAHGTLPLPQDAVLMRGHAVEARLCAEDPQAGFLPATGRIALASFPAAPIRVESGVESGDEISPYYDSMIAKLIAHGADRDDAIASLLSGLRQTTVVGLTTNLEFLQQLLMLDETRNGAFHTRLIDERWSGEPGARREPPAEHLCAAALVCLMRSRSQADLGCWTQWHGFTGWRMSDGPQSVRSMPAIVLKSAGRTWAIRFSALAADGSLQIAFGDQADGEVSLGATLREIGHNRFLLQCEGRALELTIVWGDGKVQLGSALGADIFDYAPYLEGTAVDAESSGQLLAPMMGKVVTVRAREGASVVQGEVVLVLESMKMELRVCAPHDGVVRDLRCRPGDMVERNAVLAVVAVEN
jgi:3-methylcrotonyl-CoA carboxylase alpha subunit